MELKKIIDRGLELGLTEIEVYAEESSKKSIKVEEGNLETLNNTQISGLSVRGKYQGKMGYVYFENVTEADIDNMIQKIILNASLITSPEEEILYDGSGEYTEIEYLPADYNEYTNLDKIEFLKEIEESIKKVDERIVKVSPVNYIESSVNTRIINSKGLNLSRDLSYMVCVTGVLAAENNQTAMAYAQDIAFEFKKIDTNRLVKEPSEAVLLQLGAGQVPTGNYPVVFHRDCSAELLSAFSGIFSSETALKKMTRLIGKEGQQVFGNNINIIDDPFHQNAAVKMTFDDEGYPCSKKSVVKNGVFETFLYNLKTAAHFNKQSTGNGFKAGTSSPVTVSETNLYLEPGTSTEDELIASIENGIYVTEISGLHAGLNLISGDFNVQSSGRLIKNGKLADAITLFVISGNFYEMMNQVEMIADNLPKRYIGVATPAIKIKNLAVSGK